MNTVNILKNMVYAQTDRECLTADVYLPAQGEDFPVAILVHGGAFQAGAKEMYTDWGRYLAQQGIAAMAINYRLATPTMPSYPGILDDMESAINFIISKAHEWKLEPTKIGFIGDSAGAYLGTMAAFGEERASAKVKFVVCVYGVMDIVDWAEYTNKTRTDFVIDKMFGQNYNTGKTLYESACPMIQIDNAMRNPMFDTSFFMIWGEEDDIVQPQNQTVAFVKKLEEYQIPHRKIKVPGLGHFWFTKNEPSDTQELPAILNDKIAPEVVEFIFKTVG